MIAILLKYREEICRMHTWQNRPRDLKAEKVKKRIDEGLLAK
ncbi:MAG: hypothetical protein QXZ70_03675 [Candidatus Bathyarchaeia archaeon]